MLAREHIAAAIAKVREQGEFLRGELDASAGDVNFVARFVDDDAGDFVALLRCEFAAAPLEGPDASVELFGNVGMEDEVVEAARRLHASNLSDGDGDHRADVVEVGLLAHGTE